MNESRQATKGAREGSQNKRPKNRQDKRDDDVEDDSIDYDDQSSEIDRGRSK